MKHYLVVANRTLGGRQLRAEIQLRAAAGSCHFHVLVPANRPQGVMNRAVDAGVGALPGDLESVGMAEERLAVELAWLAELGVAATGEVTVPNPVMAVDQAVEEHDFDEVLLSTLPSGPSSWVGLDVPSRVGRAVQVPVTTVIEGET